MSSSSNPTPAEQSNAAQPVARLPADILYEAFGLLSYYSFELDVTISLREHRRRLRDGYLGWVAITRVCRSWRNVAINSPTLWSYVIVPCPLGQGWAQRYIDRAQSAPLTIWQMSWSPSLAPPVTFEFIEQNLSRLERLCATEEELLTLHAPAPQLRYLRIRCSTPTLSPFILGGATNVPNLRHLHVSDAAPWSSPILTGLVILEVSLALTGPMEDHAGILDALRAMPRLVDLTLSIPRAVTIPPGVVVLDALRRLFLHTNPIIAGEVLGHFELNRDVRIECRLGPINGADGPARIAQTKAFMEATTICVDRPVNSIHHIGRSGDGELVAQHSGAIRDASALSLRFSSDAIMIAPALGRLSVNLQELEMYGDTRGAAWLPALVNAPLRRLTVDRAAARNLWEASPLLLPGLNVLRIAHVDFQEEANARALGLYLEQRAAAGYRLREIWFVEGSRACVGLLLAAELLRTEDDAHRSTAISVEIKLHCVR
ncbi:hypothetical protein FA95DRAFT_1613193 [Auriscalpium vulgare]|uniref:Uncharacterized protein n=1 Tax=Auriscalpium vulgare TaxID=40419 RepID=A0ACB8R548_9AGAM|nr:hypothetical protein FA95DRAFT_1613193 [Auriscalpium vulgare]